MTLGHAFVLVVYVYSCMFMCVWAYASAGVHVWRYYQRVTWDDLLFTVQFILLEQALKLDLGFTDLPSLPASPGINEDFQVPVDASI